MKSSFSAQCYLLPCQYIDLLSQLHFYKTIIAVHYSYFILYQKAGIVPACCHTFCCLLSLMVQPLTSLDFVIS